MKLKNLTGQKFGRLTVQKRAPNHGRRTRWECTCDCGNTCIWADSRTQARNRSDNVWLEHGGKRMILFDWAQELNIKPKTLHNMIQYQHKTLQEIINGSV